MNRELESLGQIFDNLPKEIEFISFVKDKESNEFLLMCNQDENSNYDSFFTMLNSMNEEQTEIFIQKNSNYIAALFALFFTVAPFVDKESVNEVLYGLKLLLKK
jgi:ABC-type antimicrobial peptide transport system permease subunit